MQNNKQESIMGEGLFFKLPGDKVPDFIKGKLSVNIDSFIAFLDRYQKDAYKGYLTFDLKKSRKGKYYFTLNNWKPSNSRIRRSNEELQRASEYEKDNGTPF